MGPMPHLAVQGAGGVGARGAAPAEGGAGEGVALLVPLVVLPGDVDSIGVWVLARHIPAGRGRCGERGHMSLGGSSTATPEARQLLLLGSPAATAPAVPPPTPVPSSLRQHSPPLGPAAAPHTPLSPGPARQQDALALAQSVEPEAAVIPHNLVVFFLNKWPRPLPQVLPAAAATMAEAGRSASGLSGYSGAAAAAALELLSVDRPRRERGTHLMNSLNLTLPRKQMPWLSLRPLLGRSAAAASARTCRAEAHRTQGVGVGDGGGGASAARCKGKGCAAYKATHHAKANRKPA